MNIIEKVSKIFSEHIEIEEIDVSDTDMIDSLLSNFPLLKSDTQFIDWLIHYHSISIIKKHYNFGMLGIYEVNYLNDPPINLKNFLCFSILEIDFAPIETNVFIYFYYDLSGNRAEGIYAKYVSTDKQYQNRKELNIVWLCKYFDDFVEIVIQWINKEVSFIDLTKVFNQHD